MVDENLENYDTRLVNWYWFTRDREQYTKMLKANTDRFPVIGKESTAFVSGKVVSGVADGSYFFRHIKHTN